MSIIANGHGHGTKKELSLKKFDISENTGFLPENPLKRLPGDCFKEWEDLAEQLPQLIEEKVVRKRVECLPEVEFDDTTLKTEAEWQRAYLLLAFLGQAYIWMEGDPKKPHKMLTKKIAVPWNKVSEHIGSPPVVTYAAVVLYNYTLVDPKRSPTVDNLRVTSTFHNNPGEAWFYTVHILEEFAAVPGLKAIEHAYCAMAEQENDAMAQDLQQIAGVLAEMCAILKTMFDHCTPDFFFNKLRPYVSGSKDIGIIYEGVSSDEQHFRGGSGAQDSAIPAFDIFLGAKHAGKQKSELEDFTRYMPRKHREFLKELSAQPSVREYAKASGNAELIKSYNNAVEALASFRKMHIVLVHSYIIKFIPGEGADEAKGTGGTKLRDFLITVREDAEKLMI